ncbi:MAG: tripartite tricarboxylate transporter TctB family protein [Roseibium sp.]|uniref:tripartite tricarboxylate transporter TctB family protein n=1 Tax=Roseibium sp. TaxID=1936156 RepID=UPI002612F7D7|nr:tripartite tricarboxylate transporter TctB family protein [Roseibium sp.]MCV0424181.1 tripartite tricarboxylate transporter TctB family protein [Roseibium sp.]
MTRQMMSAVVSFLVGSFFLLVAFGVEDTGDDPVGPGIVAIAFATAIMLLSIVLGTSSRRQSENGSSATFAPVSVFLAYAAAGLICTFGIRVLGYTPVIFLALAILLWSFGTRRMTLLAAISALASAGYYIFFIRMLGLHDPRDLLAMVL